MDNTNPQPGRPQGDNPQPTQGSANLTRYLALFLTVGILLTGVVVGAIWAVERASKPAVETVSESAVDFEAEKARITLWFTEAVRSISPTIELFRTLTPEVVDDPSKFALVCKDLDEQVTSLEAVTESPNATIDRVYRDWVTTIGQVKVACDAGDTEKFLQNLAISDADFTRFNTALVPFLPPVPDTPIPAPANASPAPTATPAK